MPFRNVRVSLFVSFVHVNVNFIVYILSLYIFMCFVSLYLYILNRCMPIIVYVCDYMSICIASLSTYLFLTLCLTFLSDKSSVYLFFSLSAFLSIYLCDFACLYVRIVVFVCIFSLSLSIIVSLFVCLRAFCIFFSLSMCATAKFYKCLRELF